MTQVPRRAVREWVAQSTGGDIQHTAFTRARGATSSSVYFVKVMPDDRPVDFVLRLFTNQEWLDEEPDAAEHEAAVLRLTHQVGLPAPTLVAYDVDGTACGVPAILMSYVEGRIGLHPAEFEDWLAQLARGAAGIHRIRAADLPWHYSSWVNTDALQPPAWSKRPELWERAIEIWWSQRPSYEPVFIHRDYHPTNVLWLSGKLSGIVDWASGCQGPASVDLAHCRHNLVSMNGPQAAEAFLEAYQQVVGPEFEHHPYWDIDSILDMTLPDPTFYPPWREFGLAPVPQDQLRARQEAYLQTVLGGIVA
jgi:aminoglycoside phosphotransferase (APT) family kinase protein